MNEKFPRVDPLLVILLSSRASWFFENPIVKNLDLRFGVYSKLAFISAKA